MGQQGTVFGGKPYTTLILVSGPGLARANAPGLD